MHLWYNVPIMKYIISSLVLICAFIGFSAFAKNIITITATSSAVVTTDVLPPSSVKKFTDGGVVCYVYQSSSSGSISCLNKTK